MKRFHVHVAVDDLAKSIGFYSALFGAAPTAQRDDYAKWMLEDPRVNFAISARGHTAGINHLGFQADSSDELSALEGRARTAAGSAVMPQSSAGCCYAVSDKYWVVDPQGIAWENFHTLASIPTFGEDTVSMTDSGPAACCTPLHRTPESAAQGAACCVPNATTEGAAKDAKANAAACC